MLAKKQTVAQIADRFNAALAAKEAKEAAMSLEAVEPKNQKKKKAKVFELKEKAEKQAVAKYATDLCQMSPFYPIAKHDLGKKVFISENEALISTGGWGDIYYTGWRLSVYDEDVLLGLLAVIHEDEEKYLSKTLDSKGNVIGTSYIYKGSLLKIILAMGVKTPGLRDYTAVMESIKRMEKSSFRIENNKDSRKTTVWHSFLGRIFIDHDSKKRIDRTIIEVGSFFYERVYSNSYSKIDLSARNRMTSQISKAIHRFTSAHSAGINIGVDKLATAINMKKGADGKVDRDSRRKIKDAIAKMVDDGVLASNCGIVRDDILFLKLKK